MQIVNNGFKSRETFMREINEMFDSEEKFFYDFTSLNGESLQKFNEKLSELKILKDTRASNNKERGELSCKKGEALEKLVEILLKGTGLLKVYPNVGVATNEIDMVVCSNYKCDRILSFIDDVSKKKETESNENKETICRIVDETPSLLCFDDYFIAECKNYNKRIPATWIGKFYTLLKTCNNCKLGILFSYEGLSGSERTWTDAHGLTKILRSISKNKCSIIDFNYQDFVAISQGKSFFSILKDKQLSLTIGADLSKYDIPHPNQDNIKNIINDNFK